MSKASFLLRIMAVTGIVYVAGFLVFLFSLPDPDRTNGEAVNAEAIVALTGRGERLEAAVDLLQRGAGKRLLISGVNPNIDKEELAELLDGGAAFHCCADLGFKAFNTRTNALEARDWATSHGYNSLIVVTGYEHMPRSLLEFSAEMQDMTLIPYPVGRTRRNRPVDVGLWEINAEYAKYLASWVRLSLTARTATPN